MGVRILATAVHDAPDDDPFAHVTAAAAACLARAGAAPADVELLLFVGTTRLDHVGEPSTASLLQARLGANPGYDDVRAGRATLSFDLSNTACGFLVACQTFDALARARGIRRALVVASDLPSTRGDVDHPFAPISAAAWLGAGDGDDRGFRGFTFRTAPEHGPGLRVVTELRRAAGEDAIRTRYLFDADYAVRAEALLHGTVRAHRAAYPDGPVAAHTISTEPRGRLHTTASIAGFHALPAPGPVLFAACGAGLTAMVASYDG